MATAYTSILKLALPVQGELSGTWGDVVNDNITSMVEEAIAGRAVINTWTTNSHTLTSADGTTSESRCAMLEFTDTGTALTGDATVVCPTQSKIYICKNDAGQKVTIKTSAGTGVAIADGQTMFVFCDGTNVVEAVTSMSSLKLGTAATSVQVTAVLDEDDLVSDSATALATQQSIKAYVDAQVTAQDLDFGGDSGTGSVDLDSQTFTIAGTANEIETSASGQTLTVGLPAAITVTTSVTTPLVQATNVNANDGTAAVTIADTTGQTTINDAVLTTADINGGTADNVVIGGTTPAAGSFTTVGATGNITSQGQVITNTINEQTATSGVTVDGVLLKDGGATLTGDLTVDTDTLYVDSANDRVGVNVAAPSVPFEVNVTGATDVIKFTRDTGTAGALTLDFSGANANFDSEAGGYNFETSSAANALFIKSDGLIGVGTNAPSHPSGSGITIYDASIPRLALRNSTTGNTSTDGTELFMSGNTFFIQNREDNAISMATNSTTRFTLGNSSGAAVFNDNGNDYDFRIESDSRSNALFLDGGTGGLALNTTNSDFYTGFDTTSIKLGPVASMWSLSNGSSDRRMTIDQNLYVNTDGTNRYLTTGAAARYQMNTGTHRFETAPSGSDDATATSTVQMLIENGGEVRMLPSNTDAQNLKFRTTSTAGRSVIKSITREDSGSVNPMSQLQLMAYGTNSYLGQFKVVLNSTDTYNSTNQNNVADFKGTGGLVLNESGLSYLDFRVESDSNTHMLFVDAGNNVVGINKSSPDANYSLDVSEKILIEGANNAILTLNETNGVAGGAQSTYVSFQAAGGQTAYTGVASSGGIYYVANKYGSLNLMTSTTGTEQTRLLMYGNTEAVFNEAAVDYDFRVESDGNANMLFVDAGSNEVGIGTGNPTSTLDVEGRIESDVFQFSGGDGAATRLGRFSGYSRDNSASAGATWNVVGYINLPDASFSSLGLLVKTFFPGSNYSAYNISGETYINQVNVTRKTTTTVDAAQIHGPYNPRIRLLRVHAGQWELQARTVSDNQGVDVQCMVSTSAGGADFVPEAGQVAGVTSGTVALADGNNDFVQTFSTTVGYGAATFNQNGNDHDFRVESDGASHMLFVDAANGMLGINNSSPEVIADIGRNSTTGFSNTADQRGQMALTIRNGSEASGRFVGMNLIAGGGAQSDWSINNVWQSNYVGKLAFKTRTGANSTDWRQILAMTAGNEVVFNEDSTDIDFRVESDNEVNMIFVDAGADQVRIAAGSQLFSTTQPKLEVYDNSGTSGGIGVKLQSGTSTSYAGYNYWGRVNGSGSTHYAFAFYDGPSGTLEGSISVTSSGTSYNTSSDYRLKENVVELTGATERLKQLEPKRFNFIKEGDTPTVDGFLAHEVSSVVPEAVTGTKDEVDADGNAVYQGIDQAKLVPLLVATIKELEARITALENA